MRNEVVMKVVVENGHVHEFVCVRGKGRESEGEGSVIGEREQQGRRATPGPRSSYILETTLDIVYLEGEPSKIKTVRRLFTNPYLEQLIRWEVGGRGGGIDSTTLTHMCTSHLAPPFPFKPRLISPATYLTFED
jgi:hypothetical protein